MWRWDIFCRVVDNYGDIGTCWRLAQQLAFEHQVSVRLWVDDLDCFARLVPALAPDAEVQQVGPIEIRLWPQDFPDVHPADVIIEAFACTIPVNYQAALMRQSVPCVWINLEYLSAEAWVEECHGLPALPSTAPTPERASFPAVTSISPGQPAVAAHGTKKYFFFPGFSSHTGGVLKERLFDADFAAFDNAATQEFWRKLGVEQSDSNELRISLFCYENAAIPELLQTWAGGPTAVRLLVSPGPAIPQISDWLGKPISGATTIQTNSLTIQAIPFLSQSDYDRLLWACDVNFVRGEDSFVRAQWAKRPFVWQIYPQSDEAHLIKLDAFLARYLDGLAKPEAVRQCWRAWNGGGSIRNGWRQFVEDRQSVLERARDWAVVLDQLGNLADNLVRFAREKSIN